MTGPANLAYPTRTGDAQMTYRQEPVAWCDARNPPAGPLSSASVQQFECEGGPPRLDRPLAHGIERLAATR
jgi:hypothetical protein